MPHFRCKRLGFETLESRQMLAADLQLVDVQLTNASGEITGATPVVGEKIYAVAHYRITDLTPGDVYDISWTLDGVTTSQFDFVGFAGTNVDLFWYHGGFIAQPGASHVLTVTVDSGNAVAEANEANNSITLAPFTPDDPTSLPNKFITPLAGAQNVDWVLGGYVDVNPKHFFDDQIDFFTDYQGNTTTTRDFHNGLDFEIANFAAQDGGVEVRAAAAGTVVEVRDGFFDRETGLTFGDPGNYVFIDHGDGWVSQYYHLREDSIVVAVDDVVAAGDVLGFVGSSGNSGGPHLHFEIQHNKTPVDPFTSPSDYFQSVPLYIFDAALPNNLIDLVVTNDIYDGVSTYGVPPLYGGPPLEQVRERVSEVEVFPTTPQPVIVYAKFTSVEAGDTWEVQLYRPDNSLYFDFDSVVFFEDRPTDGGWYNPGFTDNTTGIWRVDILYNDVKVDEHHFTVGSAEPEIRVFDSTLAEEIYLIDGRTTAIEFGSSDFDNDNDIDGFDFLAWQRGYGTNGGATRAEGDATKNGAVNGDDLELWEVEYGQSAPTKTFRVENHGYADLAISGVTVPTGFTITEPLNTTIAASSSDTFTVRLDSAVVGSKSGQIVINSNDASEAVFDFPVEGEVVALPSELAAAGAASAPASFFFDDILLGKSAEEVASPLLEEVPLEAAVVRVLAEDRPAVAAASEPTDPTRERESRSSTSAERIVDEIFDLWGDDWLSS